MTDLSPKKAELIALLKRIDEKTKPETKQAVFKFIKTWWSQFGKDTEITELVCQKLNMSPRMFAICVEEPAAILGVDRISKYLKPGWLKNYIDYTSGCESPEDFHIWVGMTIIGAALRRQLCYDDHYYQVYPNLYTILVSPPAVGHKNTAITLGEKILASAIPNMKVIKDKITPEAMAQKLARKTDTKSTGGGLLIKQRAEGLIIAKEMMIFLGKERYNEPMIDMMTALYDCEDSFDVETIARGAQPLKHTFMAMLAGVTPEQIPKAIPASAIGSGFMSRLTMIKKMASERCFPFVIPYERALQELLIVGLRNIVNTRSGNIVFSKDGKAWYDAYYRRHKAIMERTSAGTTAMERQTTLMIKIAMIMAVSEEVSEMTEDLLQRCHKIITHTLTGSKDLIRMIDTSERGRLAESIYASIVNRGGQVAHSDLLKRHYRSVGDRNLFKLLIETLIESGRIKDFTKDGSVTVWYRITVDETKEKDENIDDLKT